ncbi:hypothetical protein ACFCX0_39190 [Streptomyces sp. NPDC056352]|uniref:hypothetical protein n=1 Tax=Streptomyces sp. NPDC056352 TaxID=3345791 RepID=UPI0035E24116
MRPLDDVDYDQVVTERLETPPPSVIREVLGERRSSGWVLQKLRDKRGPTGAPCTRRTARRHRRARR